MTNPSTLLNIGEVQQRLAERGVEVHRQTIWRWIKNGKLPSMRLMSRGKHFVKASDVDAMFITNDSAGRAA